MNANDDTSGLAAPRSASHRGVCLVIGGSGFIGSHLVWRLARGGRRVRVLGRHISSFRENIGQVTGVEFVEGDATRPADVQAALTEVTHVVHLAHSTVPETSMRDLSHDLAANVVPMIRVVELLRELPHVERFVYVSSGGTVYGNPISHDPISESSPTQPISSYGLTKLMCEHYVRLALTSSHVQAAILRPANVYGERQNLTRSQGIVGVILKRLVLDQPVTIFGAGETVRDFTYVGDVAQALERSLDARLSEEPVPVFNVGSGVGTSVSDLLNTIEAVTARRVRRQFAPDRSFDCRYNVLDSSRIQSALGWRAETALADGLLRTWRWISECQT